MKIQQVEYTLWMESKQHLQVLSDSVEDHANQKQQGHTVKACDRSGWARAAQISRDSPRSITMHGGRGYPAVSTTWLLLFSCISFTCNRSNIEYASAVQQPTTYLTLCASPKRCYTHCMLLTYKHHVRNPKVCSNVLVQQGKDRSRMLQFLCTSCATKMTSYNECNKLSSFNECNKLLPKKERDTVPEA